MFTKKQVWETYITAQHVDATVVPQHIAESWDYCLKNNVNPYLSYGLDEVPQPTLTLVRKELQQVIRLVKDEIFRLSDFFYVKKPLFVLTDAKGVIIWRDGHHETRDQATSIKFHEGSIWTEDAVGTNAIGVAIRTEQPVVVTQYEHFSKASHPFTCTTSPILDANDHPIATLTVSTMEHVNESQYTLIALQIITKNIQNELKKEALTTKKRELLEAIGSPVTRGVICDKDNNIVAVSKEFEEESFLIGQPIESFLENKKETYRKQAIYKDQEVIGFYYQFVKTAKESTFKSFGIQSKNHAYQIFLHQLLRSAETDIPIHIYGETGSGKEVSAKTVHYNSARGDEPLISVNCGALSEDLLESELFGYAAGAFTGAKQDGYRGKIEQADKGTLFLDEVDSMSKRMQVSLLRALEEKKITPIGSEEEVSSDFRLVTASNKNLKKLVKTGEFREDLFYRIYVIPLTLPPLRERQEDIQELAHYFCLKKNWFPEWLPQALDVAKDYEWAGNIREFQNFLERLYVFYPIKCPPKNKLEEMIQVGAISLRQTTSNTILPDSSEKKLIEAVLKEQQYHMSRSAKELGIARSTLYRKVDKYNIILPA